MTHKTIRTIFLSFLIVLASTISSLAFAESSNDLQYIVDKSAEVAENFVKNKTDVKALLAKAHAVVIYPDITKGALGVGAEPDRWVKYEFAMHTIY